MTIVGLSLAPALFCVLVVFVGSLLQGAIGTGLGLLAAPLLTLVDHDFVPGAMLLSVLWLTVGMAAREREHVDRTGVVTAMCGRVPGTVLGTLVAATTSPTVISLIVGSTVMFAVLVSLTRFRLQPTRRNVLIAGLASGFTGTTTGVGGPPLAITYQHSDPRMLRGTLAFVFVLGGIFSIFTLTIGGVIGARQIQLALLLIPGVIAGFFASRLVADRLPAARVRMLVLVVCAASSLAVLADVVLG